MATFGWSYKSNVCGAKRPKEQGRKQEDWQKNRGDVKVPLHAQTHSSESINAGMKRRRFNPRAKIYIGNLSKDTKTVTLAEYFSFFGEIAYMKLMKDRETGISRGFAFITFVEVETADKATRWCKHNHPRLDDREIRVGLAERRRRQVMTHNQQGVPLRNDRNPERRDTHTLYWEYKWSEDPDAEVYGPYETSLMLQWHMADYFHLGCWVRQAARSHIEQMKTQDDTKELCLNESPALRTSLVGSYSSSSEDEENESPTEPKRGRPDTPTAKHADATITDEINVRWRPLVEASLRDAQEKSSAGDDETTFVANCGSDCGKCENCGSKEYSNENETEDKGLESREALHSGHFNTLCQKHSSGTDDDDQYVQDPTSSWYQADRGGFKTRDLLGRDSSSEDEDYDFCDIDQQTEMTENEFVHVSDINFSMFP